MKVLLLTLYFPPDIAANAVIVGDLADELVRLGHDVTVVTSVPHYGDGRIAGSYRRRFFHHERRGALRIIRTNLYASCARHRFMARLLNYVSFNVMSTVAALCAGRCDAIVAPSPPLSIGLTAAIVGLLRRAPYVYNVQDVYPDVVIRLGILKRPIAIAASRFLELFIYRRAAGITVLTEGFRRNLIAKGVPPEKIAVIPNFADPGFIRPLPASASLRTRWGLDGKFVAMHAGNLGHSQNVETLLEAAAILTSDPEIELVIVGNGSRRDELEQHARRRQLANVRFVPFVPRADVPALYATADVGLVALKAGVAAESVPSKVYSIMASARPVVAALDRDSDSWKFIVDRQCGVCVEPADARGLAEAIRRFKSEPRQRVDAGMNGRRTVLESFTPREIALQYHALLLALDSSADVASVVRQQAAG